MSKAQEDRAYRALNTLAKWRMLFAGWQLGTRPASDPVAAAVRDHREATLILRAEMSALITLLIDKGVISTDEWYSSLEAQATFLSQELESRFPGVTATPTGLTFDQRATETMKGWPA